MKSIRFLFYHLNILIFTAIMVIGLSFSVDAQYTLKDDDVTVGDGIILQYDTFNIENIIIPDTLDGQAIRGIAESVFHHNEREPLKSVAFPSTLEFIGKRAFDYNLLTDINLSHCHSLDSIGENAFAFNQIASVMLPESLRIIGNWAFYHNILAEINLSECTSLTTISERAFQSNQLTTVSFPVSLENIGASAFESNQLENIDFSACEVLSTIGGAAFHSNKLTEISFPSSLKVISRLSFDSNQLTRIDLSSCTYLLSVEEFAFYNNDSLHSFTLPVNMEYEEYGWKDLDNQSYTGGEDVYNLRGSYYVPLPYTLQDEDVVVNEGEIQECVSLLPYRVIEIPDTLDGQLITSIADGHEVMHGEVGVFSSKGMTSVSLPGALRTIGFLAFTSNDLQQVDFSACVDLVYIGEEAFAFNKITEVQIPETIESIGGYAFAENELSDIDLALCSNLSYIGPNAFAENDSIDSFYLPPHNIYGDHDWINDMGDNYPAGDEITEYYYFYYIPVSYTLGDEDVEVVDGIIQSCSYHFALKEIEIPDTLDGQAVISVAEGVFSGKGLTHVLFPATLENIGQNAFSSNYISHIDLTLCTKMVSIDECAFCDQAISSFILPVHETFDHFGWANSQNDYLAGGDTASDTRELYYIPAPYHLADQDVEVADGVIKSCSYNFFRRVIVIPDTLDGQAVKGVAEKEYETGIFWSKPIRSLKLPSTLEFIGNYAFGLSSIQSLDLSDCKSLMVIGEGAFQYNYDLFTLDLDSCRALTTIGNQAFQSCDIHYLAIGNCTELYSIGEGAFKHNDIDMLDLNGCSRLDTIGMEAFWGNYTRSIDFQGCVALTHIGDYAFFANELDDLDLSDCSSLTFIGYDAFTSNSLTGYYLPVPDIPGYNFEYWNSSNGDTLQGGDFASGAFQSYTAVLTAFYNVIFTVMDDTEPIEGARVTLYDSLTVITDLNGQAEFQRIFPVEELSYSVTASGYARSTGTITVVDQDVNEQVNMVPLNTGYEITSKELFRIYPNPARDHIHIQLPYPASLTISDITGRYIFSQELSEGISAISLDHFPRGYYLVKLIMKNNEHVTIILLQ